MKTKEFYGFHWWEFRFSTVCLHGSRSLSYHFQNDIMAYDILHEPNLRLVVRFLYSEWLKILKFSSYLDSLWRRWWMNFTDELQPCFQLCWVVLQPWYVLFSAVVTRDMVEAEDTVTAIRHLTENFGEEAEEYPLIITKPDYKKFKVRSEVFGTYLALIFSVISYGTVHPL